VAFYGGIAAGLILAVSGFYGVPRLDVPSWAGTLLEIGVVFLALTVTTFVWRMSATLDTTAVEQDRETRSTDA
jgi:hypothetical protein